MIRRAGRTAAVALAAALGVAGWWGMRAEPDAAPVGAEAHAAPWAGARMMRGVVGGRSTDIWTLRFEAGAPGRVRVLGEGGRRLACQVEDAGGVLQDTAEGATCSLRWSPVRGGNYRVVVRNPSRAGAAYRLSVE